MLFGTGVPEINRNHSVAQSAYLSQLESKKVRKSRRNKKDRSHQSLNVRQRQTPDHSKKEILVAYSDSESVETFSASG